MEKEGAVGKRFLVSSDTGFLQAGLCCVCVCLMRGLDTQRSSHGYVTAFKFRIYIYILMLNVA